MSNGRTASPTPTRSRRSAVGIWLRRHASKLRLAVTLGTFALVIAWAGPVDVLRAFVDVAWVWLFLRIIPYAAGIWLQAWRWGLFLRLEGVRTNVGRLFRRSWMARFFAYALPGSLGNDAFRIIESRDVANSRLAVARSVILDRVVGLLSLAAYLSLAGLLWSLHLAWPVLQWLSLVGFACALTGLSALASPATGNFMRRLAGHLRDGRVKRFLEDLAESMTDLAGQRGVLVLAVLATLLFNATYASGSWFGFMALGVEIAPWVVISLVPLVHLVTILPISVNGLGVREGAFVVLFTAVGLVPAQAAAVAILLQVTGTIMSSFGGVLYLLERRRISGRAPPVRTPQ